MIQLGITNDEMPGFIGKIQFYSFIIESFVIRNFKKLINFLLHNYNDASTINCR